MTRPVVLLHGFTGAPESWSAVEERLREAAPAPPGARPDGGGPPPATFAPAALGHDGTAGLAEIEGFEEEVDRLAAAVRARGLADAHLAGYSMGGRLALGLLIRHPSLFRSATLMGASPGLAEPAERAARAARDEEWARLLEREGLDTFVAAWEALPLFASQGRLEPEVRARQDRIRRSHDPRGLARSLRVVGLARMPDYRPRLADIEVPVRLVVGERDPKFRALAAELAAGLARSRLTLVPDAGHNVVLERPDEIAALLREDVYA